MRICFLMPTHWSAGLGGAEVQVRYIMDYISRNSRHELMMVCRNSEMNEDNGIPIYRTQPIWPLRRYTKAADYFSVRRLLRELKPDVVYTRRGTPLVGFAAQYCRRYDKRLVYHIAHVDDVTYPRNRGIRSIPKRLERPLYVYGLRRADVIVAQARYQAELLQRNYGLSCSAILPNFHPTPTFTEKPTGKKTVVWVANVKASKRPELFIELAERLASLDNVEFVMIGALQSSQYRNLVERATSLENLRYLGAQPLEEVNRQLERSHILVNTSEPDGEGFPNSFIQAWLRGVPTVSLDVNPDGMLKAKNLGICCEGSLSRLETAVRQLCQDDAELSSLASGVREVAIDLFSEDNCKSLLRLMEAEPRDGSFRSATIAA